ncbi:sugar phosphate isomerase/epimerase family protein [Loigolactobacillus bifermentans]|jgi:2-keto-myo-inositol isomerase|uniref:Xylose isomerase-like TIM barrel domain-containing protein n=1 Tax=Loigolactobacillus bifermentans DSM 20003 TaxID=1423726 RepID=A0A0R1GGC3_9LACO|nr:TIM barrel protein [Loigolactobacillus bifermentans]KRK33072.1 hypothetical protein FC07_GL001490 [Loigolactobacillus bifermentans DSM 20003]QGG59882.1 TIM barrel protein [Loigolactobacillus bifermentans]
MIAQNRFCLNRKVAPGISLTDTIPFVAKLGIPNIELRNDLYGAPDNQTILDQLDGATVAALLKKHQVSVETINAVGNMDQRALIDENLKSLTEMLELCKALPVKKIVFCPVRSQADRRSSAQRQAEAIANIKEYAQLLTKYQVNGLIEPLGFEDSTLRTPWDGQEIIRKAGVTNFKLVADTFHYYLANVTSQQFQEQVDVNAIGLVHLSGVPTMKARNRLDDQDRYMLDPADIMQSAAWARTFEAAGYQGIYAFEPFSDDLKQWQLDQVKQELEKSIALVQGE